MSRPSLHNFSVVSAGLLILVLAGCKPDVNVCENNQDCLLEGTAGEVCIQGMCQECIEDAQCEAAAGENAFCNGGRCEERVAAVEPQCTVNEDCQGGESCAEGTCAKTVLDAAAMVGKPCSETADCSGGYCVSGTCSLDPDPKVEFRNRCKEFFRAGENPGHESVFFEFNDHALTLGGREKLEFAAECLKEVHGVQLVLEGHCDDRGTQEYNLGLGDKRAQTVLQYLANLGVDKSRLLSRSKGENEPLCMNPTEDCWAQNRRVAFIARR